MFCIVYLITHSLGRLLEGAFIIFCFDHSEGIYSRARLKEEGADPKYYGSRKQRQKDRSTEGWSHDNLLI